LNKECAVEEEGGPREDFHHFEKELNTKYVLGEEGGARERIQNFRIAEHLILYMVFLVCLIPALCVVASDSNQSTQTLIFA
jgi:hypothetical protein